MKILVVGAGAIGGYFGGRLAHAGRDVTFLVRPQRAAVLADTGLVIKSAVGDATVKPVKTVLAKQLAHPVDLIVLSCKAYDLDSAIASIEPAVGPATLILPLLNGMRHLDVLDAAFGRKRVLGGQCVIAATLDASGAIAHLNEAHALVFGDRDGSISAHIEQIAEVLGGAHFKARASADILQEMWEKWVFLATLASATCLLRGAVGDIVTAPGGLHLMLGLFEECVTIAQAHGYPPRAEFLERSRAMLSASDSPFTASMLRDIESHGRVEADHVVGDLLARAGVPADSAAPPRLLQLAYMHLKTYEARRARAAL